MARRDALGEARRHLDAPVARLDLDLLPVRDTVRGRVVGMDLQPLARQQLEVGGAPRHGADVVVLQPAPRDEDQRVALARLVARRLVGDRRELGLAAGEGEALLVEARRVGAVRSNRPLQAAAADPLVGDACELRREGADLEHDVLRAAPRQLVAEPRRDELEDLEVGLGCAGRGGGSVHQLDAPLGIGEGAGLLQERGRGQHDVRLARGLVLEDVLHDQQLEVGERRLDLGGVRVGLADVVAADPERLQLPRDRRVKHLGQREAALAAQWHAPRRLEQRCHRLVADGAVGRVAVGQRADVGDALHVVLPA